MADEYTPERIAAARAKLAQRKASHEAFMTISGGPIGAVTFSSPELDAELGAALDALEVAQTDINDLDAQVQECMGWRRDAIARAEAAEAEVARLTDENASLLRRIEGLRLAVWGDKGQPKP